MAEAKEKKSDSQLKQEIAAHTTCKELLEKTLNELNTLKEKLNNVVIGSVTEATLATEEKTSDDPTSDKKETSEAPSSSSSSECQLTVQNQTESTSPSKVPSAKVSPSKESAQNERNLKELQALKTQLKDMFEERTTLRENLQAMDKERKLQESSLSKFKETLQNQKSMNKDLLTEILQLRELQETLSK